MRAAQGNKCQALRTVLNAQYTLPAVVFMVIIRKRLLRELGDHHSPNQFGHLSSSLGPSLRQVIRQMLVIKMRAHA